MKVDARFTTELETLSTYMAQHIFTRTRSLICFPFVFYKLLDRVVNS